MAMPGVALRSLVGRQKDTAAVLDTLAAMLDGPFSVEDAAGRLLHGAAAANAAGRFPVTLNGTALGWVNGSERAAAVASVLSHLAARSRAAHPRRRGAASVS